jgi:hypothetical protein
MYGECMLTCCIAKKFPCFSVAWSVSDMWDSWRNSSGTQLWPDEGIPARAKQRLYYAALLKQLLGRHGYVIDKDFFIIPYDWRIGIQGLEKVCSTMLLHVHPNNSRDMHNTAAQHALETHNTVSLIQQRKKSC